MEPTKGSPLRRIAFIGNYLPRQCGIATFTADLCEAVAAQCPETACFALPINDVREGYDYPARVRFEIDETDLASYRRAADFLNINSVDLVCVQHEYGIFGGPSGSHILALLAELRMPVVTTLHTVLREPDAKQRQVLERLAQMSDRLVVMSRRGERFLREIYGIPEARIDFIPHGIPDVPFVDPNFHKDRFGVEGKFVLLTFGLLAPNKGVEFVIEALPDILARHPQVMYIVLGATHPHVKRHEGESYRLQLQRLARTLGVEKNILFFDRFVSIEELIEFIGAADVYITPYLNPAQITSGTLAYAVGAGKAVVSTPYWYAEELLAEGRGVLVPFADAQAIAARVVDLLDHEAERHAMRKQAYLFGREMIWLQVARRYLESFLRAPEDRAHQPRPAFRALTLDRRPLDLPLLSLNHLRRMTDDTGLLQHACFTVPNYSEGYSTDDNARALMVMVLLEELGETVLVKHPDLALRYLAFLRHAFSPQPGRFRNFLSYERRWLEKVGSEDCHGRALWGLGTVIGRSKLAGLLGGAGQLFEAALPVVSTFTSPRAWAFAILGIHEYLKRYSGDRVARGLREELAGRLVQLYRGCSSPDWPWFEDRLTYSIGSLPHALLLAGQATGREEQIEIGLNALNWLVEVQKAPKGHFVPIGSNGFYVRGGERARFDQQPIEAHAMVSACLAARNVTGDRSWGRHALMALDWFLGRNDLGLPLYDPATGGCRDGLHPDNCNQNQGAESTVSFLLALLEIRSAETLASTEDESSRSEPLAEQHTLA